MKKRTRRTRPSPTTIRDLPNDQLASIRGGIVIITAGTPPEPTIFAFPTDF